MKSVPAPVASFLSGRRFAVAGVARAGDTAANAVFRKLAASGYEVVPINPNAGQVEGVTCYRDLASVPGEIDGVVIGTPPSAALDVVRQAAERGVRRVWFHRAFGDGSVSQQAVDECAARGLEAIVGGCPLMYCQPVDFGHRCMRWWLDRKGALPH